MYIDIVPNRSSPPAVLLRQDRREGGKVVKTTIANLSKCPREAVEAFRLALKGVKLVPQEGYFSVLSSRPHGHVEAVLAVMRRLGMEKLLASRPCRERDLVLAMLAQRLVSPSSKLGTTRLWHATTLAEELGVAEADENALYAALDWLLARQEAIEKKLARRHLSEGARVLYDVSSSSYTGRCCPLAARGYNRDKDGLACIVWGLLTDAEGRPVAVEVYPGNTGDPATVGDQVDKLRQRFGLERAVLVGDRGMLTEARIKALRAFPELGWISALRAPAIRALVQEGALQLSLFDRQNLAEIRSDAFPGERLVVCHNPFLAEDRTRTRAELLNATERELKRVAKAVERRTKTPLRADEIGVKVGKAISRYKVGKHFHLEIRDGYFAFSRHTEAIEEEARLDGFYVLRTSERAQTLSAEDTVRTYKSLGQVEQAFRCLKTLDLRIRPIHHRTEAHVKAHIFLCMLAYYVEWQMRKDLAGILFQDEELAETRWRRDPVAKAESSERTREKKATKHTDKGLPVHSFQTLMSELATRCKNTCQTGTGKNTLQFTTYTEPNTYQRHIYTLLGHSP